MEVEHPVDLPQLTSTTAPGKIFASRSALAQHYKSDWHRYNLKRREAGLVMLKEDDFNARLEAALALRKEREGREERSGTDHFKNKESKKSKKKMEEKKKKLEKEKKKAATEKTKKEKDEAMEEEESKEKEEKMEEEEEEDQEEEQPPTINPKQCLFSPHLSPSLSSNVAYMKRHYNFYIPDPEYLIDLEGLIGYCAEKIKVGQVCLYCQKYFGSADACQRHMIAKRHTNIRYEAGIDLEEFDVFYDFARADAEFLGVSEEEVRRRRRRRKQKKLMERMDDEGENENEDDEDSGEWEDISDDDDDDDNMEEEEDDDDDDYYEDYEHEIKSHGFDVTPLGELIFPDGRIIGHRGLARYYKQRIVPQDDSSKVAVVSAKRAAGERLYKGRVYDMYNTNEATTSNEAETSLALARAGMGAGASAQGRAGNGILVNAGKGEYTALSLYRYRAAVRKSRKGEEQGWRLQQRAQMNMNRMDKKANRLMNNVSVAHAPR